MKHTITAASNALLIHEWSEKGFGTHQEILNQLRKRHRLKKGDTYKRKGISFLLTFDEHCKMLLQDWLGAPVFNQIGRTRGKLCLARLNDNGHYEVGNCCYQPTEWNASDSYSKGKPATIYCNETNEIIAEGVCLSIFCKENGYNRGAMYNTTKVDRSKPSTAGNLHHHKGIYARYNY